MGKPCRIVSGQRKRIAFIIPAHWASLMGGSQYQTMLLTEALSLSRKYDMYYLARRVKRMFMSESHQVIKIADETRMQRYGTFFDAPMLISILKRVKPDIIYQRVGCAYTGIAAYYSQRNNCKMIWHISSDKNVLPFDGWLKRNVIFQYIEKKILEYGVARADCIVAQTKHQGKLLEKHYGRSPTAAIPNFQPLPKEQINKKNPLKIIWVSNFKPLKQPEMFIRLADDLKHMRGIMFIMIGSPGYKAAWHDSLMEKMDKLDNLTYLGVRTQEQVNSVLADSHILVNTSKWEGFPNTFIQGWMRKVPVVSLNVNPDDLLNDKGIGFLSGDYERLRDHVVKLIEDSDLRIEMGHRAQAYSFKYHSMKNVEELIRLFET